MFDTQPNLDSKRPINTNAYVQTTRTMQPRCNQPSNSVIKLAVSCSISFAESLLLFYRREATEDAKIVIRVGEFWARWTAIVGIRIAKATKPAVAAQQFIMIRQIGPDAWSHDRRTTLNDSIFVLTVRSEHMTIRAIANARHGPCEPRRLIAWTRNGRALRRTFVNRHWLGF